MTNYQLETDRIIASLDHAPTLLLHVCCAPCSSYVLEYLAEHFNITVFFYNPNITEKEEYEKRKNELKRLIAEKPFRYPVKMIDGEYSLIWQKVWRISLKAGKDAFCAMRHV